jgi:dihydroorotase
MTIYLTDTTTSAMIQDAHLSGVVVAAKLYPAGATTNSHQGVSDLSRLAPALQTMSDVGMLLLVHGEVGLSDTADTAPALGPWRSL